MCQHSFPHAIVSDNGTQFANTVVTNFCKDLGMQNNYVFVVHPQANG